MKRIIVTVGPALLGKDALIKKLHSEWNIYRINGAHGSAADIRGYVREIRRHIPGAAVMIDLPGNKVRCKLSEPIALKIGGRFTLSPAQLNYPDFHKHVKAGDAVWANDSVFEFRIESVKGRVINFVSRSAGVLTTNKGLHVRGATEKLPFLFPRDKELISIANEAKVAFVGLSFVRRLADVTQARALIHKGIAMIPKIETLSAVENLHEILPAVEMCLVDRGDLSTDVGLERIPAYQRHIVDKANFYNRKIFLATQFLKNMETKPIPTIAEVIDLYNTLKMGVYGIQLSEETAIGAYPVECLELINRMLNEIMLETHAGWRAGPKGAPTIKV